MGHTVLRCPGTSSSSAAARPARPSPARCAASSPTPRITLVERELVGGECSYYACMPSKALLRPAEALAAARLAPGAAEAVTGELDAARVLWHRDQVTGDWDDTSQEEWLADRDIELVRGQAMVREPGLVEAAGRELRYERLMIATGSVPSIPPIEGLDGVDYWTNREATSVREIPASLVVLGAGPVGCELAQFFSRMGAKVALADIADRLLPRDHPDAGALLRDVLAGEGIDIHLGCKIERVEPGIERAPGGRHDALGRAADRRDRPPRRRRGLRLRGARPRDLEARDRGRRAHARGRRHLGRGRRDRHRDVHARGQVPGARGGGRRGRAGRPAPTIAPSPPSRSPTRRSPRSAARPATVSSWASAGGTARALDLRAAEAPGLPQGVRRSREARAGRRLRGRPGGGRVARPVDARDPAEVPIDVLLDTIQPYPTFSEAVFFAVRDLDL